MPRVTRGSGVTCEKLICGDGTRCQGRRLAKGRIYAASSSQNGTESYFPIDVKSLSIAGGKHARYATRPETESAKARGQPEGGPRYRITKSNARRARHVIKNALVRYMNENPGVAVSLCGPGARGPSTNTCNFVVSGAEKNFKRGGALGSCVDLALVNAVYRVRNREAAKKAEDALNSTHELIDSVSSTLRILKMVDNTLGIRKLKGDKKAEYETDKFGYVGNLTSGIWLVRIRAGNLVDHCIVVDGEKREVIDSEEMYPLHLCKESLLACAGDDARRTYIAELRQIIDTRRMYNE